MARKPTISSPCNDTILGKAKHLVRRFSWDMDDQPPPSKSTDDPEDRNPSTATAVAMNSSSTTTTTTTTTASVPIASLKRSSTVPMSTSSPVQPHPVTAGRMQRSEDVEYWKHLYARRDKSTDSDIETLSIEYDELGQAWKRYQECLPASIRLNCTKLGTADDVIDVVRTAERKWSSSKYKSSWDLSRSLLNRFCLTLPAHSALLSAFGYGEEYVHLFADVLQSVIKVSVEHRKVTEDLTRSLLEVDEAIENCLKEMDFHPLEQAMGLAAKLYSVIFLFFQEVLDWYTRKVTCRLLASLNEDLYGDLHGLVTNIRQMWTPSNGKPPIATSLRSSGSTSSRHNNNALLLLEEARMSKVGLKGYYRKFASQNTLTRQLIYDMQVDARQRDYLSTDRADLLGELLNGLKPKLHGLMGPRGRIPTPDLATPPDSSSSKSCCETSYFGPEPLNSDNLDASVSTDPATGGTAVPKQRRSRHRITKMELQFSSKDLEDYFDNDDWMVQFELSNEIFADGLALVPLGEWTTTPRSQIACITGSRTNSTTIQSHTTLISGYYASVARKMSLPVVSHFCSPSSNHHHHANKSATTPTKISTEAGAPVPEGLISLGYSLIRQLVDLAPPVVDFDTTRDLSPERFAALNLHHGWGEIVSLVDTLLTFAPPVLIFIVDGVECLLDSNDPAPERLLKVLVDVLRKHASRTNESLSSSSLSHMSVAKFLFTTPGGSRVMDDIFTKDELISADHLRVASSS